jgi:hypothetical protein
VADEVGDPATGRSRRHSRAAKALVSHLLSYVSLLFCGLLIRRRAADCVSLNNRFDAWRGSTMRASGEAINPARFAASIIVCEEENVVPTKCGKIEAISG